MANWWDGFDSQGVTGSTGLKPLLGSLGYNVNDYLGYSIDPNSGPEGGGSRVTIKPELWQQLNDKGYSITHSDSQAGRGGGQLNLLQNGQQVGSWNNDNGFGGLLGGVAKLGDKVMPAMPYVAGALMTAGAAGAFGGAGAGGAAGGGATAASLSPELSQLGYVGAGGLGGGGAAGAAALPYVGTTSGAAGLGAVPSVPAIGGGGGMLGGLMGGVGKAAGALGMSTPQLIGSGLGLLAGLDSSKDQTSSSTVRMDPRMEQAYYGGLLPAFQDWFNRNRGVYEDGANQMRQMGMGLLGGGIAPNPTMPDRPQFQMPQFQPPPMQAPPMQAMQPPPMQAPPQTQQAIPMQAPVMQQPPMSLMDQWRMMGIGNSWGGA